MTTTPSWIGTFADVKDRGATGWGPGGLVADPDQISVASSPENTPALGMSSASHASTQNPIASSQKKVDVIFQFEDLLRTGVPSRGTDERRQDEPRRVPV